MANTNPPFSLSSRPTPAAQDEQDMTKHHAGSDVVVEQIAQLNNMAAELMKENNHEVALRYLRRAQQ
eukprot:CAMPEP_0197457484 /NCGR_PEP_ID=MMETSP1175-20131217/46184_1 /TAXON_ID=1003142 /ORGANISM="Triceratium dubium, Strain CCMP147" /LENGTH=66 /DNA_ID=CAMNT_0042991867 /DNA_START=41 /DNA_END=238 /DNA_ORIENTATION=+